MEIQIAARQMEIGEALPQHVRERLPAAVTKYFDRSAEAHVTFTRERGEFLAECRMHLSSGPTMRAHGTAADAYRAFDMALVHLEKQVRRHTRRLKNHRERGSEQRQPAIG